jgi:hypothetical protein
MWHFYRNKKRVHRRKKQRLLEASQKKEKRNREMLRYQSRKAL